MQGRSVLSRAIAITVLAVALVTAGTSTAGASPRASGTVYAGKITFDRGNWCLGAKASGKTGKPVSSSVVWWVPCSTSGYFLNWVIDVVHVRSASLGQIAAAANLDVCWSESGKNDRDVSLRACNSLSDQNWIVVHQIGIQNAWILDLYGRSLSAVQFPLRIICKAQWSNTKAFIVQFPPERAHTT